MPPKSCSALFGSGRDREQGDRKTPLTLSQVRGVDMSRGTTLVQLPVSGTALKASNKAAAGNGARRSVLLCAGSDEPLGDQLYAGGPHTGSHRPPAL